MALHVAMVEITIQLHGVSSLKEKRGLRKSMTERLRRRYNVSISEVEHQDSKQFLGLAASAVSNSARVIDGMFSKMLQEIEYHHGCDVVRFEQTQL